MGKVVKRKKRVEVLIGVLREVSFLLRRYEPRAVVWCFDSRFSLRKELFPEYKSNRSCSGQKGALYKQINALRKKQLKMFGFRNVLVKNGYEADDLIAALCLKKHFAESAVIVSADSDLRQCLLSSVKIWNPQKKKEETIDEFYEKYKCQPACWGNMKALAGCASDCVPGIPGIGEKSAWAWIRGKMNPNSAKCKRISDNLDILVRNTRLVVLPYDGLESYDPKIRKDHLTEGQWNDALKKLNLAPMSFPG